MRADRFIHHLLEHMLNTTIEQMSLQHCRELAAQGKSIDEINATLPAFFAEAQRWRAEQLRNAERADAAAAADTRVFH